MARSDTSAIKAGSPPEPKMMGMGPTNTTPPAEIPPPARTTAAKRNAVPSAAVTRPISKRIWGREATLSPTGAASSSSFLRYCLEHRVHIQASKLTQSSQSLLPHEEQTNLLSLTPHTSQSDDMLNHAHGQEEDCSGCQENDGQQHKRPSCAWVGSYHYRDWSQNDDGAASAFAFLPPSAGEAEQQYGDNGDDEPSENQRHAQRCKISCRHSFTSAVRLRISMLLRVRWWPANLSQPHFVDRENFDRWKSSPFPRRHARITMQRACSTGPCRVRC